MKGTPTMRLYYSPFACSLAAHVLVRERALDVDLVRVDLVTKRTEDGADLRDVHAMGQVPTLVMDDGAVLTENVAVLAYLDDRASITPTNRWESLRWTSFVATELHKKILAAIFGADSNDAVRAHARAVADRPLRHLEARLRDRGRLLDASFSSADAYLFWALTILPFGDVSLDPYPSLRAFHAAIASRPAAKEALRFERRAREAPFQAR